MTAVCEVCNRPGKLGHNVFRVRVYVETGGRRSLLLCNRCEQEIKVKPRPKQ